ncbi:hypothetical protein HN873_005823 [Arachis hypogaea]
MTPPSPTLASPRPPTQRHHRSSPQRLRQNHRTTTVMFFFFFPSFFFFFHLCRTTPAKIISLFLFPCLLPSLSRRWLPSCAVATIFFSSLQPRIVALRRIRTGPLQFQRVQTQQRLVTATASLSPMLLLYSSTQFTDVKPKSELSSFEICSALIGLMLQWHDLLPYLILQKYKAYQLTLDKTISNLDTELASAKAAQESIRNGASLSEDI